MGSGAGAAASPASPFLPFLFFFLSGLGSCCCPSASGVISTQLSGCKAEAELCRAAWQECTQPFGLPLTVQTSSRLERRGSSLVTSGHSRPRSTDISISSERSCSRREIDRGTLRGSSNLSISGCCGGRERGTRSGDSAGDLDKLGRRPGGFLGSEERSCDSRTAEQS